jgi:hypothetical protein
MAPRPPGLVGVNVSITIPNPPTGTAVGWNGTMTGDIYGRVRWSPYGTSVGKSAGIGSLSLTANWMNMNATPSRAQLDDLNLGGGYNFSVGFVFGVSQSWTSSGSPAAGFGLMTPQSGASYNYSLEFPDLGPPNFFDGTY